MVRTRTTRLRRIPFMLLALLLAGPGVALALPASLDSSGFGFEPTNLGGLPSWDFDDANGGYLSAGDPGMALNAVDVTGSTNVCILFGDTTCRSSTLGVTGPYSVIMTLTVSSVNTPSITGPFGLFLGGITQASYSLNEVQFELDPVVPASLDTSAVPGFVWNGSFTPFSRLRYTEFAPSNYDYLGWSVEVGDSVTFQYDVLTSPEGRGTPQLTTGATAVVPEPGSALLMALGLGGLNAVSRRGTRDAS